MKPKHLCKINSNIRKQNCFGPRLFLLRQLKVFREGEERWHPAAVRAALPSPGGPGRGRGRGRGRAARCRPGQAPGPLMGARSGSLQQHPQAQRGAPPREPPSRPGPSAPPARPPRPARPRYLLAGRRLQQPRAELGTLPEFPPPEAAPGPQQRLHVGPHPAARPGRGGAGGGAELRLRKWQAPPRPAGPARRHGDLRGRFSQPLCPLLGGTPKTGG